MIESVFRENIIRSSKHLKYFLQKADCIFIRDAFKKHFIVRSKVMIGKSPQNNVALFPRCPYPQ